MALPAGGILREPATVLRTLMLSLLLALATGLAVTCVLMAAVFLLARRLANNGIVDVAWAGSFLVLLPVYLWVAGAPGLRHWLLAVMVAAWSLRLTLYLSRRVAALHPTEDTRYQDLREEWAGQLDRRFFVFFQFQALAAVLFSVPHALAALDPRPLPGLLQWVAFGVWLVGLAGETLADVQLARFKADPASRGQVCRAGLWNYSRHPNYFFEWVVWCGFALFALDAPLGPLGLLAPAAMLYTLLRITGIPATEEAAVKRRGEAYREYQRTTSAFVPWFPRRRETHA